MEKLIDFLFISLLVVLVIILYRLLLKKLSAGKMNLDSFCTLYSLEKNSVNDEVEFYFISPGTLKVEFSIWRDNEKVLELRNDYFSKGGHIIRFDTKTLPNGEYFYGLTTLNQRTIKRFTINNI